VWCSARLPTPPESHFRWIRKQIDDGVFAGSSRGGEYQPRSPRQDRPQLVALHAEGMPGGVMLQIGIHYTDVLEYLMGVIRAVSGRVAQLVLPGDNPDVASLVSSTRTARCRRSTRAMRRPPSTM